VVSLLGSLRLTAKWCPYSVNSGRLVVSGLCDCPMAYIRGWMSREFLSPRCVGVESIENTTRHSAVRQLIITRWNCTDVELGLGPGNIIH
jgi:hypothetical protein